MSGAGVSLAPYRQALASPALRSVLVLGILVRAPVFAGGVLLTVHVVGDLGRSYAAAGFVSAVSTLAVAISGPWRGRLLDRFGLRRVISPSIVVAAVCWSIAPFVGYWPLVLLAFVAGILVIPAFSIMRQAVIAAVPEELRRTGIALDAAAVELSFMLAPALAVWAATQWSTTWVLFGTQMIGVGAGIVLWVVNPALRGEGEAAVGSVRVSRRHWFRAPFVAVCLAGAATTVVLSGSDIGIVATMREFDAVPRIGLVLALWALGSLIGGLLYGALPRPISAPWLLAGLAVVTFPMALAQTPWGLAWLSFVAGLLCAPTITATVDQASRLVPAEVRGEAMGWHASFMTTGSALGAPLAGFAIDRGGPGAGFVIVAGLGLVIALGGLVAMRSEALPEGDAAPARG